MCHPLFVLAGCLGHAGEQAVLLLQDNVSFFGGDGVGRALPGVGGCRERGGRGKSGSPSDTNTFPLCHYSHA